LPAVSLKLLKDETQDSSNLDLTCSEIYFEWQTGSVGVSSSVHWIRAK